MQNLYILDISTLKQQFRDDGRVVVETGGRISCKCFEIADKMSLIVITVVQPDVGERSGCRLHLPQGLIKSYYTAKVFWIVPCESRERTFQFFIVHSRDLAQGIDGSELLIFNCGDEVNYFMRLGI